MSVSEIPFCRYDVNVRWRRALRARELRRLLRITHGYDFDWSWMPRTSCPRDLTDYPGFGFGVDATSLNARWRHPLRSPIELLKDLAFCGVVEPEGFILPAGSGHDHELDGPLGDACSSCSCEAEAGTWLGKVLVDWRSPESLSNADRWIFERVKPWRAMNVPKGLLRASTSRGFPGARRS